MNFALETFGCKVNSYDSGLIEKSLAAKGWQVSNLPKVFVLNTCSVTQTAVAEIPKRVRRIKAEFPMGFVVVTGCAAQTDTQFLAAVPGVDLVVANSHKSQLADILDRHFRVKMDFEDLGIGDRNGDRPNDIGSVVPVYKSNIFEKLDLEAGGGVHSQRTRSFLKIQDGCNSFCTFCIIPFARGKSRSIPIALLVDRVNELVATGTREVVLTGVHIGDYCDSSAPSSKSTSVPSLGLEDLVEALLRQTKLERLRLSSLEPIEVSARLLDLFGDHRICKHFHLSIQSASSSVLEQMKRKYSQDNVIATLGEIRRRWADAFVGMDVIVGFPTEGELEFLETYRVLSEQPWSRIHVFPYSERTGTYATRMKAGTTWPERKARAQRLRALSAERFQAQARFQVGKTHRALVLSEGRALTRNYWKLHVDGELPAGHEFEFFIDPKLNNYSLHELHGVVV